MSEADLICPGCGRKSFDGGVHPKCRRSTQLNGLVSFWDYDGPIRKLIKEGKYRYCYHNFERLFQMRNFKIEETDRFKLFLESGPVLIPVPLFSKRLRNRGFNQAEIICKLAGNNWNLKTADILVRCRDTGHLAEKTKEERLISINGVFRIKTRNSVSRAILVDDVWTTGATMNECAKVLRKAGTKNIWGLVLAH